MAFKYRIKFSPSFIVTDTQIKTTLRYYFSHMKLRKIKKCDIFWPDNEETDTQVHFW